MRVYFRNFVCDLCFVQGEIVVESGGSISAAVLAAEAGSVIRVQPGEYVGQFSV